MDLKQGQCEANSSCNSEKASYVSCWIKETQDLSSGRRNTAEEARGLDIPCFDRTENRMQYVDGSAVWAMVFGYLDLG